MAISEEERKKILNQNFPDTVLGYKRPGDVPTDFPYSEHFPQFIAKDEVIYTLTNLIIRQLLSNDRYIKALLEAGDEKLKALIDAIDNRLASNDLAIVTPAHNGLMSTEDKKKLDGIADRANNYVHPNSGVKAGSYKQVSVNAQGHVTGGSNPNTLQGYGITDAAPLVHGNHVPKLESANNSRFLRNDNTWQTVTPGNIGAPTKTGTGASGTWGINISGKASAAGTAGTAGYAADSDKLDGYHYQDIISFVLQQGGGMSKLVLQENGYAIFGNGLTVMWGQHANPVVFPVSFKTKCLQVVPQLQAPSDGSNMSKNRVCVTGLTTRGFSLENPQSTYRYIAIGY
jgi:hypothetical protein